MKREPRWSSPHGRFVDTGQLFLVAVQAAKKIEAPRREGGESEAWISIVFAVITLESFLNEATEAATDVAAGEKENPTTALFAQLMDVLEHSSLEEKFSMAHSLFRGKPADFGNKPYQDLGLLVALRNELVHFKPTAPISYSPGYHPVRRKLRDDLRSKNILAEDAGMESWIFHVGTKAAAEWACNTAAQVILDFLDNIPESGWGTILRGRRETYSAAYF